MGEMIINKGATILVMKVVMPIVKALQRQRDLKQVCEKAGNSHRGGYIQYNERIWLRDEAEGKGEMRLRANWSSSA